MARKAAVELAKEWFVAAESGDSEGMAELLADDAVFYAAQLRGRRFKGREQIEGFLSESGIEASAYRYSAVDDTYAVVSVSARRHLPHGGLADSNLAIVFKADDDEIVCMDAFATMQEALASVNGQAG